MPLPLTCGAGIAGCESGVMLTAAPVLPLKVAPLSVGLLLVRRRPVPLPVNVALATTELLPVKARPAPSLFANVSLARIGLLPLTASPAVSELLNVLSEEGIGGARRSPRRSGPTG